MPFICDNLLHKSYIQNNFNYTLKMANYYKPIVVGILLVMNLRLFRWQRRVFFKMFFRYLYFHLPPCLNTCSTGKLS